MVEVCAVFGQGNSITFNENKSVCIKFRSNSQKPDILLNGQVLNWESKAKHVENLKEWNMFQIFSCHLISICF